MARATLAFVVVLAIAGDAQAQAPGEVTPQPQPPMAPSAPPPPSAVMQRRWAIAASLGSQTLHAEADNAPRVPFAVLELAVRLRVVPVFELALAFTGGGAAE